MWGFIFLNASLILNSLTLKVSNSDAKNSSLEQVKAVIGEIVYTFISRKTYLFVDLMGSVGNENQIFLLFYVL